MRVTLATCLLTILMIPSLQAAPLLPQGDNTIVSFGDSTTAPRGTLTVYSDILRTELPYYGITGSVVNAGVGGNTSSAGMARFQSDVLDYDPDLVIIQFGINDSTWDVWKNPPATAPRVSLATYTSNITSMTQTLKAAGSQVILMTPNPLRWTDTLKSMYGYSPYDPNDPMGFNATIIPYCQAVRNIAAAESVPLIDVYNMYVDYDAVPGQSMDNLLLDGMHPNGQGQQMVADALIGLIADGLTRDGNTGASSLTVKNSLNFVHAYEANSGLPSVEDSGSGKTNWKLFDHTAVDAGFAVSDGVLSYSTTATNLGGDWFYSNSTVSGSAWAAEVGTDTSYTIEFRAKVTGGTGAVPGMHVVTSDGENNKIWLNIAPDSFAVSNGNVVSKMLGYDDNASDYHTYRMAFEAESAKFTMWRDGVRIAENVSPSTTGAAYLGLGDLTSTGAGAAEIDYFRWDATGAYAPSDETLPSYSPPTTVLNSSGFDYKYEMNVSPTNPAAIDLDGNGTADWNNWSGATAQVSVSGGIMTMPNGSAMDSGVDNPNAFWPTTGFTAADGFTFEISLRVANQNAGELIDAATFLGFALSDSNELGAFYIGEDSVLSRSGAELASDIDNTDTQHVFRITRDANVDGGRWWVWRDGFLLTEDGYLCDYFYTRNAAYFGPGTSSNCSGTIEVDYVRMMEGAFAPEAVVLLPGDANYDGVVNEKDAARLAANWLATDAGWTMGDFNDDGVVNDLDATLMAANWGRSSNASASVPEPSAVVLLSMAVLALGLAGRLQRRR